MTLTFGSLFAGIGGMDLGLERAGLRCEWQVEIDQYANKVLAKHWPDVRRWGDVKTFPPHDQEGDYSEWRVDLIVGGDPCQANSIASAGRSTAESLAGEFLRIVGALRPSLVLRENPMARRGAPWPWWRFRDELERIGYAVLPFRLRACSFGAFHRRERVFLLGALPDANGDGLEGRARSVCELQPMEPSRFLAARDWLALYAGRGFNSRAGIPGYVDAVRGLGNAVVPQVAEWIGRRIVEFHANRT